MTTPSSPMSLVIVVPTRNRADLAINAARSALSQGPLPLTVLVSDNSTSEPERQRLRQFCEDSRDERLRYMEPPSPLSMTEHYQWAFTRVLADFPATDHFSLLTDRMVFRPGQLSGLLALVAAHPADLITYNHDRIDDYASPVRLEQAAWGGGTWRFPSTLLLKMASGLNLPAALPRMMNAVVPRHVFQAVQERHGNIFDSVAPDFNFGFRSLAIFDSVLYYDHSVLIHYALQRSNGESQVRGVASKDHLDFMANLKQNSYSFAAPIPEVFTVGNAIIHEYCVARQQTGSPRFPEIDRSFYLSGLAYDVSRLENPTLRAEQQAILARNGYRPPPMPLLRRLRRRLRRPYEALVRRLFTAGARPFWLGLARLAGRPLPTRFLGFASAEEALAYDAAHPRPRITGPDPLLALAADGVTRVEEFGAFPADAGHR